MQETLESQSTFIEESSSEADTASLVGIFALGNTRDMDETLTSNRPTRANTSPINSNRSETTNYTVDSEIDEDDKDGTIWRIVDVSRGLNNELMNVSTCSSIGSETRYSGSFHDDEETTQDVDVVDGGHGTPSTVNNSTNEVPSTSTNIFNTPSTVCLPSPATSLEHIARISNWVLDSDPSAEVDQDCDQGESSHGTSAIEKLINLCAEKLHKRPLFLPTGGSVSDFENDSTTTVFQLVATLLESDYIAEALMQIINLIWAAGDGISTASEPVKDENNNKTWKSREKIMLMVLNSASTVPIRLHQLASEKILSHEIMTTEEYFQHVPLSTPKPGSRDFVVFQCIESWINNALKLSFECQTPVIDLDIRHILTVIMEVNRQRSLYLSPEDESKYAAKAQRLIREIFFERCHAFLRTQGFVFNVTLQRPADSDMTSYWQRTDRTVPNVLPLPTAYQAQNSRLSIEQWMANDIADAVYALQRDEQNNLNAGGFSPPYGGGSSHGGSGISLREDVVNLDDIGSGIRLSQDSIGSRMNQGYTSSQSLSQGSLPRLSGSQGSQYSTSSFVRFQNFDNQYILENQFVSSSPESSQEPPWKRFRFNNSQQ